jgi:hypothetical protein
VIKFFISNAPPETRLQHMLLVAFSRWRVERCFEDHKGEIGLDHYEGRLYLGLKRHLILSAVSYLFLARTRQRLGGEKPGADRVPSAYGHRSLDPLLVARAASFEEDALQDRRQDSVDTAKERTGAQVSHQANEETASQFRHQAYGHSAMSMAQDIAL